MKNMDSFLNTVLLGDCLEVMKLFPSESIDFCLTSPAYDGANMPSGYSLDMLQVGMELYRVMKLGACCCIVLQDAFVGGFKSQKSYKLDLSKINDTE